LKTVLLNGTRQSITVTPTKDMTSATILVVTSVVSEGDSTGLCSNCMIEEGSTATDYEPYGYKIPVVCSGKNLFDKDNFTPSMTNGTRTKNGYDYTVIGNKGNEASASSGSFNVRFSEGIITPTKNLTVSVYITMLEYGGIGDKIRLWTVSGSSAKQHTFASKTVSLNERLRLSWTYTNVDYEIDALWFYVNGNKLLIEMDTLQIETNDVMTDYEPYYLPITTNIYLDEPLRKIGDYADYVDFENRKVVKNVSETILKGTEDCYSSGIGSTNERIIYDLSVFNGLKGNGNTPSLCTHTKTTIDANVGWAGTKFVMQVANADVRFYRPFYCEITEFTEKTPFEWKQYLARLYAEGNPFKVYSVRSETSEETINLPKLPSFKGTTVYTIKTSVQPSEMSATYYAMNKE